MPSIVTSLAASGVSFLGQQLWNAAQVPPKWGVFDSNGNSVLSQDSVLELIRKSEYRVSDFPVQAGAFASYNKVKRPSEIQLRVSKGGTVSDRRVLLNQIANLCASLAVYRVMMPEGYYQDMNPYRYEVSRRGPHGAYFLTEVDIYFIQIMQVTAQYTTTAVNTTNASAASAQPVSNNGSISPQVPDSSLSTTAASAASSTMYW